MRKYWGILFWTGLTFLLMATTEVQAGGPISVSPSGTPSIWESPIALDPEAGTCASFSNGQMVAKLTTNIGYWSAVADTDLDFTVDTGNIATDVNSSNYLTYFVDSNDDAGLNDNLNPVVFDDDGLIVRNIFGNNSQFTVLGFAGPDGFSSDFITIRDGQAFFNCRCLAGNPSGNCLGSPALFSEDDLNFTMTHEIGHLIGLDHTAVNQALADAIAPDDCDAAVDGDCDDVPTMYPQSVDPADQISPTRDDEVALQTLYGLSTMVSGKCTVTGTLHDSSGKELRCADVHAETTSVTDTIAVVSGIFAPNDDLDGDSYTDGDGECLSNCGDFTLYGLDVVNHSYNIKIYPIDADWVGGSSLSPCANGQIAGIVEELIGTLSQGTCSNGQTIALGTITTGSTGGVDPAGSSSGSTTGGCSLKEGRAQAGEMIWLLLGLSLVASRWWLVKKRS